MSIKSAANSSVNNGGKTSSFSNALGTYSNPALDVMLGIDPGAQKFLADAEKKYPAPPSILDKILSFFN